MTKRYFSFTILDQSLIGGDSAPDVFVAKISSQTDHNYSLIVHNEPEVEVETEVETTIPLEVNDSNILQTPDSYEYQIVSSTLGTEQSSTFEIPLQGTNIPSGSFSISAANQVEGVNPIGEYFESLTIKHNNI